MQSDWVFMSLATVPLTLQITLFISLLKAFYCNKDQTFNNAYKCSTIGIFIFSIMLNAIAMIIAIMYGMSEEQNPTKLLYILHIVGWISIFGASILTYLFLLFRVYFTFKESMYEIKKCTIYLHSTNIASMSLLLVSFLGTYTEWFDFILFSLWLTSLSIGYTHLLYLFNHNLFLLVLSQRQTIINDEKNIELNQRQINLLCTIRKHTILGFFMVLSSLTYLAANGPSINSLDKINSAPWIKDGVMYLVASINFISLNTSPFLVYLGFNMNRKLYSKLCSFCDKKCKNICIRLTEKNLDDQDRYVDMNEIEM